MKNLILLGQFNRNVGLKYQSLLQEEGIDVVIEDWSNSLEVTAGFSLVRLLVSVQDYQRSLKLIDDFEDSVSKMVTDSVDKMVGKEIFKAILGIIFRVLIILGIIVALFFISKYYNLYSAKKFIWNGMAEYKRGNFTKAVEDFTKEIEIYHYDYITYLERGMAYYKLGNFNYAIANLGYAIAINPNYEHAYYDRGFVYYKRGNFTQAISDFTHAIELNSKDALAFNNRGYLYAEQGNLSQAFDDINNAIEIDPKNKYAYFSRAYAYFKQNDYDKAWADVHKAETLGKIPDKKDLEFLDKLKKASGRDK